MANDADFYLNKNANGNFQIDRIGFWTWAASSFPSDIVTRISSYNADRHRIDEDGGLKILFGFEDQSPIDSKAYNELELVNDPRYFNVIKSE